jgi:predicted MPP superfamily phosphohydrolase
MVRWIVSVISSFIFIGFIMLYIWPLTARSTTDYTLHLIYNTLLSIDFVFKVPLALSLVIRIFFSKKQRPVINYIGLILSIGISSSVVYGSIFGKAELVVNNTEMRFQNLPESFNGFKIMQISDTHLGNFLHSQKVMIKVLNECTKAKPDIILFTGDLVNNFAHELTGWEDIFKEITSNASSYSILGNHDYGDYTNWESNAIKTANFNQIVSSHDTLGFQMVNNEHIKIKTGPDSIFIIGVENWGHPPFPQYANLEKAMAGIPEKSFKILMSHDPAHWDEIIKYRPDIALTLSGHTHGLQWGIKKAGLTFSLSYLTRKQWGGLYEFEKSKLYVNAGLGTVGIPFRINMPAEISFITLKRIEID